MQPKWANSQAASQPAGRRAASKARSAAPSPRKKYRGGDSSWTIATSGGRATTCRKRRSRPASRDLSTISRPRKSSLPAPPQPVGRPRVAATRATFQQAPPATLRQLASPVRTKSVSASPKTTSRGRGAMEVMRASLADGGKKVAAPGEGAAERGRCRPRRSIRQRPRDAAAPPAPEGREGGPGGGGRSEAE